MQSVSNALKGLTTGPVSDTVAPLPDDPEALANHIKATCYFLGTDIVGICEVPEYAWFSHDWDGNPVKPEHRFAIVLLIDQGYETMAGSTGDDWISSAQSYHAYNRGSVVACTVANYIRQLGHDARAHTNDDSRVQHLPLTLLAGCGELSRIGEVVLNPFLGPRFKTAVVTTNLPMATDKPIDFGLQDFCRQCMKCARECPCAAISFGEKVMFNGYEMWKPDVAACARYRIMNPGGSACGRCMKVCPFNKPGLLRYRAALWFAVKVPASRKLLIWLDDWLSFGRRVAGLKWWFDMEWRGDKLVRPKRINQRKLRRERTAPPRQNIRFYGLDSLPPLPGHTAHPLHRKPQRREKTPLWTSGEDE
jgi:reductive dehalogenase